MFIRGLDSTSTNFLLSLRNARSYQTYYYSEVTKIIAEGSKYLRWLNNSIIFNFQVTTSNTTLGLFCQNNNMFKLNAFQRCQKLDLLSLGDSSWDVNKTGINSKLI